MAYERKGRVMTSLIVPGDVVSLKGTSGGMSRQHLYSTPGIDAIADVSDDGVLFVVSTLEVKDAYKRSGILRSEFFFYVLIMSGHISGHMAGWITAGRVVKLWSAHEAVA